MKTPLTFKTALARSLLFWSGLATASDPTYVVLKHFTGTTADGGSANHGTVFGLVYPPVITSGPASRTNSAGTVATFSVTADGSAPLVYQWRKNDTDLTDGGNVSG